MSILVFSNIPLLSNIPADHFQAEEQRGVVWRTLDPSRFRLPSESALRIRNWPMLCAEIVDEGEMIYVIVAAPHWDEGGDPIAYSIDWTGLKTARELPLGMISVSAIPGAGAMAAFVSLNAIAAVTIGPAPDERGHGSEAFCLTARKTSNGVLAADLRRGFWDRSITKALQFEAFLGADWPSGGSPRAHLHPREFPSQDAGAVVLALAQKRKRRLVLCYAGDAAWLESIIASRELGRKDRPRSPATENGSRSQGPFAPPADGSGAG